MHVAEVVTFVVHLMCMTNFHPISSSDLDGCIILFKHDQDICDLIFSNTPDTGEKKRINSSSMLIKPIMDSTAIPQSESQA